GHPAEVLVEDAGRHLAAGNAARHPLCQLGVEYFPADNERVAVAKAGVVVVQRRLLELPHNVALPVELEDGAAGPTEGPCLLPRRAAQEKVSARQQVAVIRLEGSGRLPALHGVAVRIDQEGFVAGQRREEDIAGESLRLDLMGETCRLKDGVAHVKPFALK